MTGAAELLGALAGLVAAGIAVAAWRLASKTFQRDHRPLIRVVAASSSFANVALDEVHGNLTMGLDRALLKNLGRGPALGVVAFDPGDRALIGDVDAVEPLGPGAREADRLGRAQIDFRQQMRMDRTYELYYQDVLAKWHLTRFRPVPGRIECSFVGIVADREVPSEVKHLTTVAKP